MKKIVYTQKKDYIKPVLCNFGKMQLKTKNNDKASTIDNVSKGTRGDNIQSTP